MVHGTKIDKLPLSSEKSTLIALSGVILAKVFSRSFMVLVCWTVWIGLHLIYRRDIIGVQEIFYLYKEISLSFFCLVVQELLHSIVKEATDCYDMF